MLETRSMWVIHRGRLNPGGSKFLDWYRENFPEYVKTISDGEKGAEVIIVGMLSDNDFIQQLENFIRRVISFKNWFRSGDMSDSNIQDVEIDSEVGSEAGINYRHLIKKNVLDGWYKITIEKNLWDSWSFPPDKKTICYALVDSNSLVTLYKGQINANNVIDYANVELSSLESNAIFNIVNSIISDPITARKKLDDGDVVPHVGHMNPIYLTVERYNNPDFTDGRV